MSKWVKKLSEGPTDHCKSSSLLWVQLIMVDQAAHFGSNGKNFAQQMTVGLTDHYKPNNSLWVQQLTMSPADYCGSNS